MLAPAAAIIRKSSLRSSRGFTGTRASGGNEAPKDSSKSKADSARLINIINNNKNSSNQCHATLKRKKNIGSNMKNKSGSLINTHARKKERMKSYEPNIS